MKHWTLCWLLVAALGACRGTKELVIERVRPMDDPLVEIAEVDPRIRVFAVYATSDNFVGEVLYPEPKLWLRRSAMTRLSAAQDRLEEEGFGLVVWDAYRPWTVTERMWDVIGDPEFVADPSKGSRHNRGMAVDCGLVDRDGVLVPLPTEFDAFVEEARSDAKVGEPMRSNRDRLIGAMEDAGFRVLGSEWWHFDAKGWEERALLDVSVSGV